LLTAATSPLFASDADHRLPVSQADASQSVLAGECLRVIEANNLASVNSSGCDAAVDCTSLAERSAEVGSTGPDSIFSLPSSGMQSGEGLCQARHASPAVPESALCSTASLSLSPLPWQASADDALTREVIAWLLRAIFERFNPAKVAEVPSLMSKYENSEVHLLTVALAKYVGPQRGTRSHCRGSPSTAAQQVFIYADFVKSMRAHFCTDETFEELAWPSNAQDPWLRHAFFQEVWVVLDRRLHMTGVAARMPVRVSSGAAESRSGVGSKPGSAALTARSAASSASTNAAATAAASAASCLLSAISPQRRRLNTDVKGGAVASSSSPQLQLHDHQDRQVSSSEWSVKRRRIDPDSQRVREMRQWLAQFA